ncbi:alpha-1,4-N-acetylglucosaminyltransferase-like [Macrobrachium rosenbergii]|uniref:alpha-1,4-N-acetylglucosaminyltransferase-like n=1 Tax=Macrobrachium rosenbergii TaxID=79674 RepID=UPI0034D73A6A
MVMDHTFAPNRTYSRTKWTKYVWIMCCSVWMVSVLRYFHSEGTTIPDPRASSRGHLGKAPKNGEWYDLLCPRYRLQKMTEPTQLNWLPPNEDTIVFTQTSCGLNFNGRQACAVESAARHHPHQLVTVFVTGPLVDWSHPLIKILTNLDNVLFSWLDLDDLFSDSPLQHWYQEKLWLINEEHQSAFISDASRAEILRKYGGTYMDLDALTLRPLPNRTNYLGRVDSQRITGAIMSLVKGHPLSHILAKSIPEVYKPFQADSIGPALVNSALRELCPGNLTSSTFSRRLSNTSSDNEVSAYLEDTSPYFQSPEMCSDLTIYPEKMFYPIGYHHYTGERALLFKRGRGYGEKFLRASKAFSLHLYNSLTWMEKVVSGGDSILEEAMRRNCPSVHQYMEENVGLL